MHVRNRVAIDELQGGVLLEEGHHRAAIVEECIDSRRVVSLAELVPEVGSRLLRILADAGALRERIAGDPHPSARPCGRAAEHRFLLHDNDLEAVPRGGDRGGEPGGAGTDDEQVAGHLLGFGCSRQCHHDPVQASASRVASVDI